MQGSLILAETKTRFPGFVDLPTTFILFAEAHWPPMDWSSITARTVYFCLTSTVAQSPAKASPQHPSSQWLWRNLCIQVTEISSWCTRSLKSPNTCNHVPQGHFQMLLITSEKPKVNILNLWVKIQL